MRCNDFDTHIDEMLSGILHPDANEHMRQCERCTSHFRARAAVQNGLRQLASATQQGPSRATDRAVMDGYRQLQQRWAQTGTQTGRSAAAASIPARKSTRLLSFPSRSFPSRGPAAAGGSRSWLTGSVAAAVLVAVLGSAIHLWNGAGTVNAPNVASAPVASAAPQAASVSASPDAHRHSNLVANLVARRSLRRLAQASAQSNDSQLNSQPNSQLNSQPNDSQLNTPSEAAALLSASSNSPALAAESVNSTPQMQANSVMHLATAGAGNAAGAASNMAQSASSTWPGYSNLMYCDPMACSGPMQVVHIKVPVGQVKPNLGQSVGNGFVNAEVVVGPDGVARAIRVAN
jgi:hypothetical protein